MPATLGACLPTQKRSCVAAPVEYSCRERGLAVHITSAAAGPMCALVAVPPARPAATEYTTDEALVVPTAEAVASPVA